MRKINVLLQITNVHETEGDQPIKSCEFTSIHGRVSVYLFVLISELITKCPD